MRLLSLKAGDRLAKISKSSIWLQVAATVALGVGACGAAVTSLSEPVSAVGGDLCQVRTVRSTMRVTDAYDRRVLSLGPVLYLALGYPSSRIKDLSGNGHSGLYLPRREPPSLARLPNRDPAAEFDGFDQYVQVASAKALSITQTGCLTVEAWIRPGALQFPREEGSGYVYVLGKGTPGKQEYALRMYSRSNSEVPVRPNRISAYVFNLAGGLGSGAYFQDRVTTGKWIMVTFVMDDRPSASWPDGYVAIYKDAELRGKVSLDQYDVRPQASNAPLRIATRNLDSYFKGAIAKVAIYDYVLSRHDISLTYRTMFGQGTVGRKLIGE